MLLEHEDLLNMNTRRFCSQTLNMLPILLYFPTFMRCSVYFYIPIIAKN